MEGCNFSPDVLSCECNSGGDVVKTFRKVYRETYSNSRPGTSTNFNEAQKDIFVIRTETVKKNNFTKHIKESKTHAAAVTNVADKGCPCQKGQQTIMRSLHKVSSEQTSQLTLKFQLAHFVVSQGKGKVRLCKVNTTSKEQSYCSLKQGPRSDFWIGGAEYQMRRTSRWDREVTPINS